MSSTSSERSFSLAGRTLDDRRSQLSGDTVGGLLFKFCMSTDLSKTLAYSVYWVILHTNTD